MKTTTCLNCAKPFTYSPYRERGAGDRPKYCGRKCKVEGQRRNKPASAFARFLWSEWQQSGQSQTAFMARIGMSARTFRRTVAGHIPSERLVDQLRSVFGDGLPSPPARPLRDPAKTARPNLQLLHVKLKSRKARRGKKRDPEVAARAEAARVASGAKDRAVDALKKNAQSPIGRRARILGGFLRQVPDPDASAVRQLAFRAGQQYDVAFGEVLTEWGDVLRRHDAAISGPKFDESLCVAIREAVLALPAGCGRKPYGFWVSLSTKLGREHEGLKQFWQSHSAPGRCPEAEAAEARLSRVLQTVK